MTASNPTATHSNIVPSEVGWQFVPQYYTFVNKEPHRLHCFYNKNSTFIHGTEGEDMKPCFGQQEIHNKITSIGFDDCKVFIHSVDAQSSANGGIIIQVIGEMSNHGDPWRKFVQTFFLAEQPNGYFVLNDIFRFLKEETVEDSASDAAEEPIDSVDSVPVAAPPQPEAPVREPTPPPAPVAEPEPAPLTPVEEAPAATPEPAEPAITQTPTPAPEQQQALPTAQPNGIHTPEPEKAAPEATPEPAAAPAAAPQPPAPVPAPQPAAPAAPRSWASLAASNSRKWGAAVAQESRGTTETLSPAPSTSAAQTPSATPAPGAQRPPQGGQQDRGEHPAYVAAQSVTTAQCFVKGVTEPVSQPALQQLLTQRFGPIKELEIVRSKACAFLEFVSVDSARRAIVASLSQNQGGEGGVWVDSEAGRVRISVETKKERGERPVNTRGRGAAPGQGGDGGRGQAQGQSGEGGRGQGSFRGRGGAGRGRGGAQAK
ncbi:hypothetical protein BJ912DRAFT_1120780 [Pholiota molesta]|nr:hypothetical protein BJ912DRAFT_1120780 [Pholiota molesta]